MCGAPNGAERNSIGRGAGGQNNVLRGQLTTGAVMSGELDAVSGKQLAVTLQGRDTRAFEQRQNALGHGLHDAGLALLHLRHVHGDVRRFDAMGRKFFVGAVIELGGLKERLGRNAASVQAGAAERGRAVLVLPLVDARDVEFVLCSADSSRITGGTATNDNDVKRI